MGLIYTKKKDEETQNTADPWNVYGVGFGRESKADSKKVAWEVRSTTEDLPAGQKDTSEADLVISVNEPEAENTDSAENDLSAETNDPAEPAETTE